MSTSDQPIVGISVERREETPAPIDVILRDMQELTEGIVETVRHSLVVLDGEMRIIKANNYFYETFKVFPRETEGLFIYELGNGQWNIPRLKELLERILPANNPFDNFEVEHDFPHIGRRIMLLNAREIHLRGTRLKRILLAIEDITEQRENERRKDDFIVMASHELRTPVTSIKGFTQILQHRLQKQGDQSSLHFLIKIDSQLTRLMRLIKDMLDLSRIQTGTFPLEEQTFDLYELLHETIQAIQGSLTQHTILLDAPRHLPIYGDRGRLEQVFVNLLTNAAKFSPGADRILVHILQDGDSAIVSVQDFGIGLYLANEIVKRHNGHMAVQSRPDQGATFFVILPLAREKEHL